MRRMKRMKRGRRRIEGKSETRDPKSEKGFLWGKGRCVAGFRRDGELKWPGLRDCSLGFFCPRNGLRAVMGGTPMPRSGTCRSASLLSLVLPTST